jgi:hypothetical protein
MQKTGGWADCHPIGVTVEITANATLNRARRDISFWATCIRVLILAPFQCMHFSASGVHAHRRLGLTKIVLIQQLKITSEQKSS